MLSPLEDFSFMISLFSHLTPSSVSCGSFLRGIRAWSLQSEKAGGSPSPFANLPKYFFCYISLVRLDLAFRRRFIDCSSYFFTLPKAFPCGFSSRCGWKGRFYFPFANLSKISFCFLRYIILVRLAFAFRRRFIYGYSYFSLFNPRKAFSCAFLFYV